jgi:hypothetical protein
LLKLGHLNLLLKSLNIFFVARIIL